MLFNGETFHNLQGDPVIPPGQPNPVMNVNGGANVKDVAAALTEDRT